MLIVDDEFLVRLGVRNSVEWSSYGIEIIDEAADGEMGLELAIKHKPDIILTDIRMPFMDGMEFMSKIRDSNLESSIIVLSGYDEFAYVRTAMDNGASAYLLKPIDNEQLIETVCKVAEKIKEDKGTKQYYQKLVNELTGMKKQFVRDLIAGNVTNETLIRERIKFLDVPLDVENNYVIVIQINQFENFFKENAGEEIKAFRESVQQDIAGMLLHSSFIGIVEDMSLEEWVVIVHANQDPKSMERGIRERCLHLSGEVGRKYKNTLSIGISRLCRSIGSIHETYREVCVVLTNKFLPNTNWVVSVDQGIVGFRKVIREALHFLQQNYARDLTVEIIANELYISPSYLMHLFKAELGKTFNDCLIEIRIEKAKELLRHSRYKIYEVCSMVGYSDSKYFSQIFKKVVGMSPSEYVK